MKVSILYFCFILTSSLLPAQILPVSVSILEDNTKAFEFIDSEIEGVRLVGIGEATHGSSEFKTVQCNLFKYLVENHEYNTFFLEDEYVYSLPIDQYIKGGIGNVDSLVAGIRNWPWKTPQMISLISWMRTYNASHNNVLSFVGTDFQDHKELKQAIENKYSIPTEGLTLNEIEIALTDAQHYNQSQLILKSLNYWANGEKRDVAMAELILKYLELNPQSKGVFCAHNTHLLKIYVDKKNDKKDFALAGGQLDHFLKEQYYVLVSDFDHGEFYAHTLKKNGLSKRKYENHEFRICEATCADKKFSICKYLSDRDDDIMFISNLNYNEEPRKWFLISDIGATFYPKKNGKRNKQSISYLKPEWLDAILFFKSCSAAEILK